MPTQNEDDFVRIVARTAGLVREISAKEIEEVHGGQDVGTITVGRADARPNESGGPIDKTYDGTW